jgi:hypothetical protein
MSMMRASALSKASEVCANAPQADELPAPKLHECDMCGQSFEGAPAGSGLLLWTRGEEVRYEEPPLCERCSRQLLLGALMRWAEDEEEE